MLHISITLKSGVVRNQNFLSLQQPSQSHVFVFQMVFKLFCSWPAPIERELSLETKVGIGSALKLVMFRDAVHDWDCRSRAVADSCYKSLEFLWTTDIIFLFVWVHQVSTRPHHLRHILQIASFYPPVSPNHAALPQFVSISLNCFSCALLGYAALLNRNLTS